MKTKAILFLTYICLISVSCSEKTDLIKPINEYYCIDNNGRSYNTVEIGEQVWMSENLAYLPSINKKYSNSTSESRFYVFNYEGVNTKEAEASLLYKSYGVLYNYQAALSSIPKGWHIPTDEDWKQLEKYLGMTQEQVDETNFRGQELISIKARSSSLWSRNNGTNEYGINILPSGIVNDEFYKYLGERAYFWTSSETNGDKAWIREFSQISPGIARNETSKRHGLSVRCVKDR